jgi:hypothetical protein
MAAGCRHIGVAPACPNELAIVTTLPSSESGVGSPQGYLARHRPVAACQRQAARSIPGAVRCYSSLITSNHNWNSQQLLVETTIPPTNDFESAIVTFLAPAGYTAVVSGVGNTIGIALVEVYALH